MEMGTDFTCFIDSPNKNFQFSISNPSSPFGFSLLQNWSQITHKHKEINNNLL